MHCITADRRQLAGSRLQLALYRTMPQTMPRLGKHAECALIYIFFTHDQGEAPCS
jgi:hypothetical protein